jgi:hypothetical protein
LLILDEQRARFAVVVADAVVVLGVDDVQPVVALALPRTYGQLSHANPRQQ